MTETIFEELKRYVGFGEADARLMADFHTVAAPHFERISQDFYDAIREHEQAHDVVFTSEAQIARLRDSLVAWMHRLCSGAYDEQYFEQTAKIGRVHVQVGLPQRYMLTAMALIRLAFLRLADDHWGRRAQPVREAICRLLDIELATMLETYRDEFVARTRQLETLERKHFARAPPHPERNYVNAVELARSLMVGVDAKGAIRLFNREAERVTGFSRDEVIGSRFVDTLLPEEARALHEPTLSAAIAGASTGEFLTSIIQTRTGQVREIRWQLAHAPPDGGADEIVLFAVGQDVTEERAVSERNRQHEKLAAVGTLAAGLAHEIRNPLNGAQLHVAYLERALKRTGANPEMFEAVAVVSDEIKRLARLVTDFLDFARPKPLVMKVTSIATLCQRAVQLVRAQAEAGHTRVVADLPARDVLMEADGAKLEQVLLNLLQNGIEALVPTGGGTVVLRVRRRPRRLVLEVEDDGPGLQSHAAPIFDAFYSTKSNGTGLGLAITHRIVSDHRGIIDVESRPGRTIFRVTFPLESTRDPEPTLNPDSDPASF